MSVSYYATNVAKPPWFVRIAEEFKNLLNYRYESVLP